MAFLFPLSVYVAILLVHSISHCTPVEKSRETRSPAFNFNDICNNFQATRIRKVFCFLCKGFDISCLLPSTTTSTTTTTTTTSPSTTSSSTTTPSSTTPTSTTPTTTAAE